VIDLEQNISPAALLHVHVHSGNVALKLYLNPEKQK
jgi:hypothetical protein